MVNILDIPGKKYTDVPVYIPFFSFNLFMLFDWKYLPFIFLYIFLLTVFIVMHQNTYSNCKKKQLGMKLILISSYLPFGTAKTRQNITLTCSSLVDCASITQFCIILGCCITCCAVETYSSNDHQ